MDQSRVDECVPTPACPAGTRGGLGDPDPGLFLRTASSFHCAVVPLGQLSTDSCSSLLSSVRWGGLHPAGLFSGRCVLSIPGLVQNQWRECGGCEGKPADTPPRGGLGVDGSGDQRQAPPGRGRGRRIAASGPEGQLLLETCAPGTGGGVGTAGLPLGGPAGCTATAPLLRVDPAAAAL